MGRLTQTRTVNLVTKQDTDPLSQGTQKRPENAHYKGIVQIIDTLAVDIPAYNVITRDCYLQNATPHRKALAACPRYTRLTVLVMSLQKVNGSGVHD